MRISATGSDHPNPIGLSLSKPRFFFLPAKERAALRQAQGKRCLGDRAVSNSEAGFSLVELVVALVIIGLLAATVVLTMPDPRGNLTDAGDAFAARARAAQESAIVESRDMALWVTGDGYGFERYEDGAWSAIGRAPFEDHDWPEGISASFAQQSGERTRVIFDVTGLNDPLELTLARDEQAITVRIGADGTIRVDG